ncbi:MAG: ATP-dependent helicase [Lachnospiraceae bacterium]|nr:ATP-dependent helicase [Lachnospiraceae bacterium]
MLNLENLNDAQRKAVTYGVDPLLVLAGPGSGKTTVVIQRIFYLMEVLHVSPEKILVLTFTKDAALSMQKRFINQSEYSYPVTFGTFHSCFYHILKKSPGYKGITLITDVKKKELLYIVMKKYNLEINSRDAEELLTAISYYKNTNNQEHSIKKVNSNWQAQFLDVFREYEILCKEENFMDFDDMVRECFCLLSENDRILEEWQERFPFILLDEFQDINPIQYKVIRLLAQNCGSVFAVGDDDQSIYSFRGASPSCIKKFQRDFAANTIILEQNYRSNQEIVNVSMAVIGQNKSRFQKKLYSAIKGGLGVRCVKVMEVYTKELQYEMICKEIVERCAFDSSAVLFRTNLQMQRMAVWLDKKGIKYVMKEKTLSIYEHFVVKDIIAYLKLAKEGFKRSLYLQIINRPYRGIDRESVLESGSGIRGRGELELQEQLMKLKKCSLYLGVQYIRRAIGYEDYLRKKAGNRKELFMEWFEILDFISEDIKQYHELNEWIEALKERRQMRDEKGKENISLQLMTVHGAKGLEFDYVYIPDCNEGIYPYGSMQEEAIIEEERRILYVAMTRAKKSLGLSYLGGNEKHPRLPSRFLNPILKDYSSTISSNSQLSKYSSKASATFSYSSSSSI